MRDEGFTLVEMLVVITVMALLATGVVLTLPTGGGARDAASRFAARAAAARDTAVLTGRPTGLWVSPSGYGFEQLREGQWQALDAKPFAQANWGRDVQASLSGQARVRFDSVGMPDRALDVGLSEDGQSSTVRIAPNGDVVVP